MVDVVLAEHTLTDGKKYYTILKVDFKLPIEQRLDLTKDQFDKLYRLMGETEE